MRQEQNDIKVQNNIIYLSMRTGIAKSNPSISLISAYNNYRHYSCLIEHSALIMLPYKTKANNQLVIRFYTLLK